MRFLNGFEKSSPFRVFLDFLEPIRLFVQEWSRHVKRGRSLNLRRFVAAEGKSPFGADWKKNRPEGGAQPRNKPVSAWIKGAVYGRRTAVVSVSGGRWARIAVSVICEGRGRCPLFRRVAVWEAFGVGRFRQRDGLLRRGVAGAAWALVRAMALQHVPHHRNAFAALNLTLVMPENRGGRPGAVLKGLANLLVVQRVADADVHGPPAAERVVRSCWGQCAATENDCQLIWIMTGEF